MDEPSPPGLESAVSEVEQLRSCLRRQSDYLAWALTEVRRLKVACGSGSTASCQAFSPRLETEDADPGQHFPGSACPDVARCRRLEKAYFLLRRDIDSVPAVVDKATQTECARDFGDPAPKAARWDMNTLVWPNLLSCLRVQEILRLRATSWHANDTGALASHAVHCADFGRPTSLVAFVELHQEMAKAAREAGGDGEKIQPGMLTHRFAQDLRLEKMFRCQVWYMLQAHCRRQKLLQAPEPQRQSFLKRLISDLALACRSPDSRICAAAHYALDCCGKSGSPLVHALIAESMHDLLESQEFPESAVEDWRRRRWAVKHLRCVLPSLDSSQRKRWMESLSLLLSQYQLPEHRKLLSAHLDLLIRADPDSALGG
ncbi:hypothetical protein AK812_SmicGene22682 [Symbiodinium microadriaticum]|uniref:Uncharacterized protein n=1 Tax=Symbiodinium microadriaticum TaxID=2951 RepID=A0A1Q9DJ40_SYMMI|nr:hypothetical protein AK812_SmicGene22682 [Symbiodinium microadriaticum]